MRRQMPAFRSGTPPKPPLASVKAELTRFFPKKKSHLECTKQWREVSCSLKPKQRAEKLRAKAISEGPIVALGKPLRPTSEDG